MTASYATCQGCGAPIVWAISPTGARIPLSAATVYVLVPPQDGLTPHAAKIPDDAGAGKNYVSHFITCPKRDQFSGRGRQTA